MCFAQKITISVPREVAAPLTPSSCAYEKKMTQLFSRVKKIFTLTKYPSIVSSQTELLASWQCGSSCYFVTVDPCILIYHVSELATKVISPYLYNISSTIEEKH